MGSVNLFYPENQMLARRCQEMVDDIVNMQSTVQSKFDDDATVAADLKNLVNNVMKAHGFHTYDELEAAVLKSLTPDQRAKIEKTINDAKKVNNALDITFQVCLLVTAVTGTVGLSAKAFDFVKSGAFMNAMTKRIDTITQLFKGTRTTVSAEEKAAEVVLEEVAGAGGEAAAESVTIGAKVARFCKIVAVIGVAVDVFLIGLAAYEGHEQQVELVKNIHYLNVRRIYCKIYSREASALVSFSGQLKSVLTLMALPNQEAMKPAIDAVEQEFLKNVKTTWSANGVLQAYADLNQGDVSRGSYLKEDLSLGDIKAEMAKNTDDPINAPTPKSGAKVATIVTTNNFVKMPVDVFQQSFQGHALLPHATFA